MSRQARKAGGVTMAKEKIERLDLTEVAANKPKSEQGPKVKEADQTGKPGGSKPGAPSVSLKDVPPPKK
jgi:hypothetical protein